MAAYTRQSAGSIVTGAVIQASHFNAEYNAIEAAFNASTGHTHDGTVGEGAPIPVAGLGSLTSSSGGHIVADGANGYVVRTITGTADKITVTNGTGVSGNPTLTIASTYAGQNTITTLGTISTGVWNGTAVPVAYGGTGATDASTARTNLGLAIGTDVQAQDSELAAIAGLTSAADRLPYFTGSGTASLATFTSVARNLLDDSTTAAQRTTLGVGTTDSPQFASLRLTDDSGAGSNYADIFIDSTLTNNRTVLLDIGDASRTITLSGNPTLSNWFDQSVKTSATPTFTGLRVTDTDIIALSDITGSFHLSGWNGAAFVNLLTVTSAATPVMNIADNTTIGGTDLIQHRDAELTAIAGLTSAANKGILFTGSGTASVFDLIPTSTSWTPTPTNLTVVGSPTYTGRYIRLGDMVFFTLQVSSTTTTASTANSTYFEGLPFTSSGNGACIAVNSGNVTSYGNGLVLSSSDRVYTPTWAANAGTIVIGFYKVA